MINGTEINLALGGSCPECGSPAGAGHTPNCSRNQTNRENEPLVNAEPQEAMTDKDREDFFRFYAGINQMSPTFVNGVIKAQVEAWRSPDEHLVIIKDRNSKIIAGAELEIQGHGKRKEAYLSKKVVDANYRGQGLAAKLVHKRLEIAKQVGCVEAWSLVNNENESALRTIFKDGFSIKGRAKEKMTSISDSETYYVNIDLQSETPKRVSIGEIKDMKVAQTLNDAENGKILIPWQNNELINEVLAEGYLGRQILMPTDFPEGQRPTENLLYFEKLN